MMDAFVAFSAVMDAFTVSGRVPARDAVMDAFVAISAVKDAFTAFGCACGLVKLVVVAVW